jgi:hypothetical protein
MRSIFIGILIVITMSAGSAMADAQKKSGPAAEGDIVWLDEGQVAQLLVSGALWCMEPEAGSCLFTSLSSGPVSGAQENLFAYDVVELWDENTRLSVPTIGVMGSDGSVCETIDINYPGMSITDATGEPLPKERFIEVREEMAALWEADDGREYCFKYAIENPAKPELISQYLITEGQPDGEAFQFFVDYGDGAPSGYDLRF